MFSDMVALRQKQLQILGKLRSRFQQGTCLEQDVQCVWKDSTVIPSIRGIKRRLCWIITGSLSLNSESLLCCSYRYRIHLITKHGSFFFSKVNLTLEGSFVKIIFNCLCVCVCAGDCRGFRLSLELDLSSCWLPDLGAGAKFVFWKISLFLTTVQPLQPQTLTYKNYLYLFEVYECITFIHNVWPGAFRGHKTITDLPEQELQAIYSNHKGAGDQSSTKGSVWSQPLSHLSNPTKQNCLPVHSHTCRQVHFSWFLLLVMFKQEGP